MSTAAISFQADSHTFNKHLLSASPEKGTDHTELKRPKCEEIQTSWKSNWKPEIGGQHSKIKRLEGRLGLTLGRDGGCDVST